MLLLIGRQAIEMLTSYDIGGSHNYDTSRLFLNIFSVEYVIVKVLKANSDTVVAIKSTDQ